MRTTIICTLIAATVIASGALAGSASARITGRPGHGCPYGAFCIYPGMKTWRTGPERHGIYYSYGAHNLHHQFGWHLIYNNQYKVDGIRAGVSFCRGRNGRHGWADGPLMKDHWAAAVNLTPVNSVTLWLYDSDFTSDWACRV